MPMLQQCCCCCQLSVGAIILGWLNAIGSFINFVSSAVMLSNVDGMIREAERMQNYDVHVTEQVKLVFQIGFSLSLTMSIINVVAAILLIIGAVKKNRYMLLPWLYSGGISLIGTGIIILILLVVTCANFNGGLLFVFLICSALYGLQIYFWLCVLSLFQSLREEERNSTRGPILLPQQQMYATPQIYPQHQLYPQQQIPLQQQAPELTKKNDLPAYSSIA